MEYILKLFIDIKNALLHSYSVTNVTALINLGRGVLPQPSLWERSRPELCIQSGSCSDVPCAASSLVFDLVLRVVLVASRGLFLSCFIFLALSAPGVNWVSLALLIVVILSLFGAGPVGGGGA